MDAFPPQAFNNLLPELAQANAVASQLWFVLIDSHDISLSRIGVHPEQQIGNREIEKTQRVGLDNLCQIEEAPQSFRGRRNSYCQQRIASFGRRNQVADRTDAADPGHERWHFGKWAAFTQLFKTTELRDMKLRVFYFALVVKVQGDLGVPLDAGHRVYHNFFERR